MNDSNSVQILTKDDRYVVQTTFDGDLSEMPFELEGFAKLYAKGQKIHIEVLEGIRRDEQAALIEINE
jgi:hypothetical protein